MEFFLTGLILSLFFLPPALAGAQTGNEQGKPSLVRAERLAQQLAELAPMLRNGMHDLPPPLPPLSERQRSVLTEADRHLLEQEPVYVRLGINFSLGGAIEQLSKITQQAAAESAVWRTYLEQAQMLEQLPRLAAPQQLVRQVVELRGKLNMLDEYKVYWSQLSLQDQQEIKMLQHELSRLGDFVAQQGKRN